MSYILLALSLLGYEIMSIRSYRRFEMILLPPPCTSKNGASHSTPHRIPELISLHCFHSIELNTTCTLRDDSNVGVVTAVRSNITLYRNVQPCTLVHRHRFERICLPHVHNRRWTHQVLPKHRYPSTNVNGVHSYKELSLLFLHFVVSSELCSGHTIKWFKYQPVDFHVDPTETSTTNREMRLVQHKRGSYW